MDVMTEAKAKHPDHLSLERGAQRPSVSAEDRAQSSSARGRGTKQRQAAASAELLRFREDQMLDGAVRREWKSPNRGLLRVKQKEGGSA